MKLTQAAEIVAGKLDRMTAVLGTLVIGPHWPIKNEISQLPWGRALAQRTGIALYLPVVCMLKAPLEYWRWASSQTMPAVTPKPFSRSLYNIPMRAVLTERRDTLPQEWTDHAA